MPYVHRFRNAHKPPSKAWGALKFPLARSAPIPNRSRFYSGFFAAHGLPYHPDIEAFTADQILPMVEADLGIGFVPEEFLEKWSNVCRIDLEEKYRKETSSSSNGKANP